MAACASKPPSFFARPAAASAGLKLRWACTASASATVCNPSARVCNAVKTGVQTPGRPVPSCGRFVQPAGHLVQPVGDRVQPVGRLVKCSGRLVQPVGRLVQRWNRLVFRKLCQRDSFCRITPANAAPNDNRDERSQGRWKLSAGCGRDEKAVEGHRTPRRWRVDRGFPNRAQRPGVRQPSGALAGDKIKRQDAKTPRRGEGWPSAKTFAPLCLCAFALKIYRGEINGCGHGVRSEAMIIAQPFMAGAGVNQMKKSREGRQKSRVAVCKHLSSRDGTLGNCRP